MPVVLVTYIPIHKVKQKMSWSCDVHSLDTVTRDDHMAQTRTINTLPMSLETYKGQFPSWGLHVNMQNLGTSGSNILPCDSKNRGSLSTVRELSKAEEALTKT